MTEEDLKKGFEANYGPRVPCRAIVLNDLRRAQKVWDEARKIKQRTSKTENFRRVGSEVFNGAQQPRELHGQVPPIRMYGGQPQLEEEAFKLQPGDLSGVINVDEKFIILFCEGYTKPIDGNL